MIHHRAIADADLRALIKSGQIRLAGNARLKIYGRLDCATGKRMRRENRVFFADEAVALAAGYHPCGSCLRADYLRWKSSHRSGRASHP